LIPAIIGMNNGSHKPQQNAANYEKTADENVMHGQNLKIMLLKTRTLR
jgi:hypothetical protein